MRRSEIEASSETAMAAKSSTNASGWPWKLPPDTTSPAPGPAAGPRPSASALPLEARSGGAGFYYGDVREHIPTPGSFSAAEGRAYLEATAEAVAASLRAMAA